MTKPTLAHIFLHGLYGLLTFLVSISTLVILVFLLLPNKPDLSEGFPFYYLVWPILAAELLAACFIPMALVSFGVWKIDHINTLPNKNKWTALVFLPAILCFLAILFWIWLTMYNLL